MRLTPAEGEGAACQQPREQTTRGHGSAPDGRPRRVARQAVKQLPSDRWELYVRVATHPKFPSVGAPSQALLLQLATFIDAEAKCWPSIDTLAGRLGCHRSRVSAALTQLAEAGLLAFPEGRKGGRTSSLTVVLAALPDPAQNRDSSQAKASRNRDGSRPDNAMAATAKTHHERKALEQTLEEQAAAAPDRVARTSVATPPSSSVADAFQPETLTEGAGGLASSPSVVAAEPAEFTALVKRVGKLTGGGRAQVLSAWREEPEGVGRCVAEVVTAAATGRVQSPGGLLIKKIRDSDHLLPLLAAVSKREPPCPECGIGAGHHVDGCSRAGRAPGFEGED